MSALPFRQTNLSFDSQVFHLSFRWSVADSDTKVTHTDSNVMISGVKPSC